MNIGGAKVALVSEVLDRLLDEFGGESARRSVLFQAALQICADESRRVKQGQPPAPLEVLVERARTVLNAPPGEPPPDTAPEGFDSPAPPRRAAFPSMASEEARETLPEEEPPTAAVSDFYVDESVGEELVRRHRRLPAPLLLGVLALLAVAAGTFFIYSRYEAASSETAPPRIAESYPPPNRAPVETPRRPEEEAQAPAVAPTSAPPAATPTVPPSTPVPDLALPEPVEPRAPGAPARVGRPVPQRRSEGVEVMASPDWGGRAPIFVIHFSSYRERDKAQRDAAEVGRRFGRPAYVARITLPSGVWYRVVLGDFATADQARAFHADLAARGTPDLGAVYRLTAQ